MKDRARALGVWAIIPVKALAEAKSRLRVSKERRRAIAEDSYTHVLRAVSDAVPVGNIVVISRDAKVLALARLAGAQALCEVARGDLNDALSAAALFARERGAKAILSIFSDMPFVTAKDIEAMLTGFDGRNVVIAPNEKGDGSNALLMEPCAIAYRHGEDSFRHHLEAIRMANRMVITVARPGLMRDVDTLEDLKAYAGDAPNPHSSRE